MLKISTLNNKFVINHDDKTTVIPYSDFISFTFFKYSEEKTYESDVNFVSEKQLDGFDILAYDKGKFVHQFYSISKKNPFENKSTNESNPFININHPELLIVQLGENDNDFVHYINLDYLTCFDIMFDTNKTDGGVLFKVKLDDGLDVEAEPFELKTYIDLYIGNRIVMVETERFIKALQNIQNPSKKALDILDIIKQKLNVNNSVQVLQ